MQWARSMNTADLDTERQRARFEAVRRRVFEEMRHMANKWRLALIVPFHLLVIGILAAKHFPANRLAVQVIALLGCIAGLTLSERATTMRKAKLALLGGGIALMVTIGNTGGLASPLVLSVVPFIAGVSMNP